MKPQLITKVKDSRPGRPTRPVHNPYVSRGTSGLI
jgi:hypothetical protein